MSFLRANSQPDVADLTIAHRKKGEQSNCFNLITVESKGFHSKNLQYHVFLSQTSEKLPLKELRAHYHFCQRIESSERTNQICRFQIEHS